MIPDRLFYPLAALVVVGLLALALVWPQGQGAPSPGAFKHPAALPPGPYAPGGALAEKPAK